MIVFLHRLLHISEVCFEVCNFKDAFSGVSDFYKKCYKNGFHFLTGFNAAFQTHLVPRFFSAVKKDFLEEIKNGHL